MLGLSIIIILGQIASFPLQVQGGDPRRFFSTSMGVMELGTCNGPTYSDNRPRANRANAVFRNYAAGRIAFRSVGTGIVQVGNDEPRLSPVYARIHYCAINGTLYYLAKGYGYPAFNYAIFPSVPLSFITEYPVLGTNDVDSSKSGMKILAMKWRTDQPQRDIPHESVPLETVHTTHFDFSQLPDGRTLVYTLNEGQLKQLSAVVVKQHRSGRSMGTRTIAYKTDLTGPFWIVQVVPEYFIAIQRDGRVVLFMSKTKDQSQKVNQLFRQGKNVKIIHDGEEASVESDSYQFRVTPTGIHLPVAIEK